MAFRVNLGKVHNSELEYLECDTLVRVTENLEELCDKHFVQEKFLEEEEEINISIVYSDKIPDLIIDIDNKADIVFSELKNTKGKDKISELIECLKDYWLLKKIAVELMLKANGKQDYVLTLN